MKLLIIFLAQLALSLCGVFVQKLTRKESARSKMIKTGNWVEYNKYQENLRAISLANAQKRNITQRLMDYVDHYYVITVAIGTPPQEFSVRVDTRFADFWIPSITCKKFPCIEKHRFNPAESSTYAKVSGEWKAHYGTHNVKGKFGEDTLGLANKMNTFFTIPQVRIGEATEIASYYHEVAYDGVLGLGFQSLSDYEYSPVLMEAYKKGVVDEPIFTVYLERHGGLFALGRVDTDHCGEVTYTNLTDAAYWQFKVDRVQMGDSLHEGPFEVVSDMGSSRIIGPVDIISSMYQKISAQKLKGIWVADCATTTTFDITIEGKVYSIQPENYLLDEKVHDKCVLAIVGDDRLAPNGFSFVLGAPFYRQFCHTHDMGKKRIGFATILERASSDK